MGSMLLLLLIVVLWLFLAMFQWHSQWSRQAMLSRRLFKKIDKTKLIEQDYFVQWLTAKEELQITQSTMYYEQP